MNGHGVSGFAFTDPLVVLGATALVIPIFHRLKISPVVGFILLGLALGPFGLGSLAKDYPLIGYVTITSQDSIEPVAEWGVVLLLFMIGLELSFERLNLMRRLVFGLGPAQVIICATAITGVVMFTGVPLLAAIVVGLALAQSSTAVLVQTLAAEKKLTSPVGRSSFAVLLFQDIAVVPILFGIYVLGAPGSTFSAFGLAVGQAALAVIALIIVGRLALRPLFSSVARTQSDDVFLAACLLVILAASIAASAGGLSAAMGALIAGLLLAETEYRRQIEVLIEPFKNLFLGVFLISAGMGIDLRQVAEAPLLIIGGGLVIVALKALLIFLLARAFGLTSRTALGAALLLAPGGEFAFIILGAARGLDIIPPPLAQGALLIAALTMISIPFLLRLYERITREPKRGAKAVAIDPGLLVPTDLNAEPTVVIAGFGRVGRVVAEMLETHKVPYIGLDTDVDVVATARREGKPIYYGDAANPSMLKHIGLENIRALVATMDSSAAVQAIVGTARREREDLLIVARARDAQNAARLYKLGANDVAPETIEASLQLSETVLVDLGIPMGPVIASIHDRRAAFRDEVQKLEPGASVPARPRRRLRDALRKAPDGGIISAARRQQGRRAASATRRNTAMRAQQNK